MSRLKKITLLLGDVLILYLSLATALFIRYAGDFENRFLGHLLPFSLIFIFWVILFYLFDLYQDRALRNENSIVQTLSWGVGVSATISALVFYLFGDFFSLTPKTNLVIFSLVFFILDYLWRSFMSRLFSSGAWGVGILGDSPLIEETIEYIKEHPHTGYKIVAWKKSAEDEDFIEMTKLVLQKKIQFFIVQTKLVRDPRVLNAIYRLLPLETNVMNFSDFYESIFGKVPVDEVEERWFVEHIVNHQRIYDAAKSVLDFLFSLVFGILFLPFIILFAILIRLSSKGPAIYRQKRVGKNGMVFTLYKFRTMLHNGTGPLWTEAHDKRVTPFGKFLRFTHLDELPQLWNIVRGDISVTGPRPERVELVEQYQKFPFYEIRHLVKPGLTGWAQINFKPSASLEEAREKLEYDIYYVKNRSFLLDLFVILRTLRYLFTGTK